MQKTHFTYLEENTDEKISEIELESYFPSNFICKLIIAYKSGFLRGPRTEEALVYTINDLEDLLKRNEVTPALQEKIMNDIPNIYGLFYHENLTYNYVYRDYSYRIFFDYEPIYEGFYSERIQG